MLILYVYDIIIIVMILQESQGHNLIYINTLIPRTRWYKIFGIEVAYSRLDSISLNSNALDMHGEVGVIVLKTRVGWYERNLLFRLSPDIGTTLEPWCGHS